MNVENFAECSLGTFCNAFDLHRAIIGLKFFLGLLFEWVLKTGFTVFKQLCGIAVCLIKTEDVGFAKTLSMLIFLGTCQYYTL